MKRAALLALVPTVAACTGAPPPSRAPAIVDHEAEAFGYLAELHAPADRKAADRALEQLNALEDVAPDDVDRAALRFAVQRDPCATDRNGLDGACEWLADRGFEPSDRALAYRKERAAAVTAAALAHDAGEVRGHASACVGLMRNGVEEPDAALLGAIRLEVPDVAPLSRCAWPRAILFEAGRVRWTGEHEVKIPMLRSHAPPRESCNCRAGYVLVLHEEAGAWRVVRRLSVWIS